MDKKTYWHKAINASQINLKLWATGSPLQDFFFMKLTKESIWKSNETRIFSRNQSTKVIWRGQESQIGKTQALCPTTSGCYEIKVIKKHGIGMKIEKLTKKKMEKSNK